MRRAVSGKCRKPAVAEPDILNLNELRNPKVTMQSSLSFTSSGLALPFDDVPPVHLAGKIIKNVSRPGSREHRLQQARKRSMLLTKQRVSFSERPTTTVAGCGRGSGPVHLSPDGQRPICRATPAQGALVEPSSSR